MLLKNLLKRAISVTPKKSYMDENLFEGAELLQIYGIANLRKIQAITGSLGFCSAFQFYRYNFGEDKEFDGFADALFGSISLAGFLWMSYTMRRTMSSLSIAKDGRHFIVNRSIWFGLKTKTYTLNHQCFKGVTYFIAKPLRMPMVMIKDMNGKKLTLFFNGDGIVYREYFDKAIGGYSFDVLPEKMQNKMSNKRKKKFNLERKF